MRKCIYLKGRSGIYAIVNSLNNKVYVGRTKCMYKRCSQYVYDFENRSIGHLNNHLYNAMVKSGINNFDFVPLEFASDLELPEKELLWMDTLKSCERDRGYNLRRDSDGHMVTSSETSGKISNNLKQQWASGVRDGHSQKLKENWKNNPLRSKQQSKILSINKTRYQYIVYEGCESTVVNYSWLKQNKLHNVITHFHRKKSNDVIYKGVRIIRKPIGE